MIGVCGAFALPLCAQSGEEPVEVFGYFQTSGELYYDKRDTDTGTYTTFNAQQLNILFRKQLSTRWSSFINVEFLNSFSAKDMLGSASLDEAWVRYRRSRQFDLRIGLQVPRFNNLNEIKNRTPLLPYVVRPIVYEESFNDFFALEEFVPERAFVQASGVFPAPVVKVDYAVFLGNSPNLVRNGEEAQSGTDSTLTFLVGGRIGLRTPAIRFGVSATRDELNFAADLSRTLGLTDNRLVERPRYRWGTDFSVNVGQWLLDAEAIWIRYDFDVTQLKIQRQFAYATLGYYATDRLFVYGTYWYTNEEADVINIHEKASLDVYSGGVSFAALERVTLKAQYAAVEIDYFDSSLPPEEEHGGGVLHIFTMAVSVLF